ncbi:MAG TPA: hypothetical protein VL426_05915 [Candidatus Binatia bacterium]|nr:hypothetical protein [Candidatus Binatia bacterium]
MVTSSRKPLAAGLLLAGLVAVGAGCGPKPSADLNAGADLNARANVNVERPAMKEPRQMLLTIDALGGSGISGKALLVEQEDKTKVMLNLNGTTQGHTYPAHIHLGACPTPGEVKYSLASVAEGKSVTLVDASFDAIVSGLPLAINVHKSDTEISTYVACGDLLAADVKAKEAGVESMMSSSTAVKAGGTEAEGEAEAKTTVTLRSIGNLGAAGTATIEAADDKTKVTINLTGAAGTHPAFLRHGMCPNPGDAKYTLTNVVDGKSTTTLDAKLADVMGSEQLAIDVRGSATDLASILVCGDLPLWDAAKMMFKI